MHPNVRIVELFPVDTSNGPFSFSYYYLLKADHITLKLCLNVYYLTVCIAWTHWCTTYNIIFMRCVLYCNATLLQVYLGYEVLKFSLCFCVPHKVMLIQLPRKMKMILAAVNTQLQNVEASSRNCISNVYVSFNWNCKKATDNIETVVGL